MPSRVPVQDDPDANVPNDGDGGGHVVPPCPTAIRQSLPVFRWYNAETGAHVNHNGFPEGLDGPRWDELYPQATPFSSTAEIHAALLRCPDVQVLQVRTAFRGCTEEPNRFNFPFDIGGTDRYASAPVLLSLDGHEFDWSDWSHCQRRFPVSGFWGRFASIISQPTSARLCLPYLSLPEDRRDKTPLDLWLEAIDFSRIRTLQLNNTQGGYTLTEQVVEKLPQKLTSLESLMVHNQIAASFILALPKDS